MHDSELLCRMLVESLSTFVMLFRHALRISGHTCPSTREAVIQDAERVFGIDSKPATVLSPCSRGSTVAFAVRYASDYARWPHWLPVRTAPDWLSQVAQLH